MIELPQIRGDLHVHTNWSDGDGTPEEMVVAALDRGYEYVAISDHSVSMGFIHGLTLKRIDEQRELIENLRGKYPGIHILHGIEVNIRSDGALDYDDEIWRNSTSWSPLSQRDGYDKREDDRAYHPCDQKPER